MRTAEVGMRAQPKPRHHERRCGAMCRLKSLVATIRDAQIERPVANSRWQLQVRGTVVVRA